MNAIAAVEKKIEAPLYAPDSIIRFEEGLIGFSDCKSFVLMENEGLAPFRRLQSTEKAEVGFLVIEPSLVFADFNALIPSREWDSLDLHDPQARIVFAICIIGHNPAQSTGNFQAPLIVNYKKMTGKQIILTESGLTSRHPLLPRPVEN